MITIGKNNKLKILEIDEDKLILDAENLGKITAINNDFIIKYKKGDIIDVFLYPDEKEIKAVIGNAFVTVGEFAFLEVIANTKIGSFFDIGIEKDLFCPFSEQRIPLVLNNYYVAFFFIDEKTNRITASTKLEKFLSQNKALYKENESVNIIITSKSDFGYSAIVDNNYKGFLYSNEVFTEIKVGQKYKAYVKKIREDNKIDLKIIRNDHEDIELFERKIINFLKNNDNKMCFNDNSSAEEIRQNFEMSKKNFKKTIGALYRKKIIIIDNNFISLNKKDNI